jgi:tRNA U55 pseudouridine synthase TruB
MAVSDSVKEVLVSMDEALADFPAVRVDEAEARRVMHGNRVPWHDDSASVSSGPVRIYGPSGGLLALARAINGEMRPELVFS